MANSAAAILRLLVAGSFEIPATEIKLSGEISADYDLNKGDEYTSSCGRRCDLYELFGFHPTKGFVQIQTLNSSSTGSGQKTEYLPKPLYQIPEVDKYIFFVEQNHFNEGSWNGAVDEFTYTVYKAPDFKKKVQQITNEDIIRWENWMED